MTFGCSRILVDLRTSRPGSRIGLGPGVGAKTLSRRLLPPAIPSLGSARFDTRRACSLPRRGDSALPRAFFYPTLSVLWRAGLPPEGFDRSPRYRPSGKCPPAEDGGHSYLNLGPCALLESIEERSPVFSISPAPTPCGEIIFFIDHAVRIGHVGIVSGSRAIDSGRGAIPGVMAS